MTKLLKEEITPVFRDLRKYSEFDGIKIRREGTNRWEFIKYPSRARLTYNEEQRILEEA